MSEELAKGRQIDALLEALSTLWDKDPHDVPEWVAQEVTLGQMRLLFLLSKNGPAPISRVAEWLGVGLPTASGAVERVERHGLVSRQHRLDDRRVVECQLTDAGRHLMDEISGMRLEAMKAILGVLDEEELDQMAHLISVVVERRGLKPG
jgi:DNA-binding MarR family transcriptional regulator